MIVIGIDPDSSKHGVAVYVDGDITFLESITLMRFIELIKELKKEQSEDLRVHIENVCGMIAVFRQRQSKNAAVSMKMANSIGRCQQSQLELERVCEHYGVEVVRHKISKQWKGAKYGKPIFEKVTGWTGRSNEDTRSAAYFGWLGLNQ